MKKAFEELVNFGFFKKYRPFSVILFADQIKKKTGASVEINSDFSVKVETKKWMIVLSDKISVSGKFSDDDYLKISEAIATAKAIIYNQIGNEVREYPIKPSVVWAAYNEAVDFGFEEKKIKRGKKSDSKASFDFPGKYKLGAMYIGSYKDGVISTDEKFLKNLLSDISNFFLHYGDFAYGRITGDVEKFRVMTLGLAQKGDFVAQRVYVAITKGYPIKITDFRYLNKIFGLNVKFKRGWSGEGW